MTAINQDVGFDEPFMQGDSLTLEVPVFEADGTTPADITGTGIRWEMFRSIGGIPVGDPLVAKTVGSGITIDTPADSFTVVIDPEDTIGLDGTHYHEAEITFVGGIVSTVLTGRWKITRAGIQPPTSP